MKKSDTFCDRSLKENVYSNSLVQFFSKQYYKNILRNAATPGILRGMIIKN